ncbi:Protein N-terminal asparagine amidohydrolase [Bienertia sinuspersici]
MHRQMKKASMFMFSNENMLRLTLHLWMTSVAHMDSPKIVDLGLSQMLSKLVDSKHDSEMDDPGHTGRGSNSKQNDHSLPLCAKIIESLRKNVVKFHIQTLFVLGYNTKKDTENNPLPIFNGFLVETRTGTVIPATYDHTTRCPDEVVRRIRVSASFTDSRWRNKLLETYDTQTDRFIIAPCSWSMGMVHMAYVLHQLPESEILRTCSTSPFAEAPDFVHNQRRQWNYLIEHPNWKETFRMGEPRIFTRSASGEWIMVEQAQGAAR